MKILKIPPTFLTSREVPLMHDPNLIYKIVIISPWTQFIWRRKIKYINTVHRSFEQAVAF